MPEKHSVIKDNITCVPNNNTKGFETIFDESDFIDKRIGDGSQYPSILVMTG
jgi:hypothetical protein